MHVRAALACLALVASPLSLRAQRPAPPTTPSSSINAAEPPSFNESIDVRVVNVEALVTDRKGNRVHGLKAEDFRLEIDGKDVAIDFMTERGQGAGAPTGADEGAAFGAPQGRNLLFFLDDSFALKTHRDMVLKKMGEQLDGLQPDDRVALVSFDGDRLSVLSDWTSDRAAIVAALAKAKARPSKGIEIIAWRRSLEDDVDFLGVVASALGYGSAAPAPDTGIRRALSTAALDPPLGSPLDPKADPSRNERLYDSPAQTLIGGFGTEAIVARVAKVPLAVMAAMRAFSQTPGRKIMVLLAGGWPSSSIARPIAVEANRLGYTLYPVDVPGIDTTFIANDASSMGPSGPSRTAGWEGDSEYTLELMARATGGKASLNSARLAALPRVLEDTSSYYWLSFSPHWVGDDRSHRIELVARRPDLEVRARRSFSDLSLATRTQMDARSVLLFGGDEAGHRLRVTPGVPQAAGPFRRRVAFELAFPLAAFTPFHAGSPALDLILSAQSLDSFNTRTLFPETPVHLALDGTGADATSEYRLTLRLRRRRQQVQFTLRDPQSGTVIWGETQLSP